MAGNIFSRQTLDIHEFQYSFGNRLCKRSNKLAFSLFNQLHIYVALLIMDGHTPLYI